MRRKWGKCEIFLMVGSCCPTMHYAGKNGKNGKLSHPSNHHIAFIAGLILGPKISFGGDL